MRDNNYVAVDKKIRTLPKGKRAVARLAKKMFLGFCGPRSEKFGNHWCRMTTQKQSQSVITDKRMLRYISTSELL